MVIGGVGDEGDIVKIGGGGGDNCDDGDGE